MGNGRGRTVSLGSISKVVAPGYYEPEYGFGGAMFPWHETYNDNFINDIQQLDKVNRPLDETDVRFSGVSPIHQETIQKFLKEEGVTYDPDSPGQYVADVVVAVQRLVDAMPNIPKDDEEYKKYKNYYNALSKGLPTFVGLAKDKDMTLQEKYDYHIDNWYTSNLSPWSEISRIPQHNATFEERRRNTHEILKNNKIARDRYNEGVWAINTVAEKLPKQFKNSLKEINIGSDASAGKNSLAWVYNKHDILMFNESRITDRNSDEFYNYYENGGYSDTHNVGTTWTDTALHEYGHHIFIHVLGMHKNTEDDYLEVYRYAKKHQSSKLNKMRMAYCRFLDEIMSGEYEAVSRYGCSSIDEAIAESFALYVRDIEPVMGKKFHEKFENMMDEMELSHLKGLIPTATKTQLATQEQAEELKMKKFLNKEYKNMDEIENDYKKGLFNEATYDIIKEKNSERILKNKVYESYSEMFKELIKVPQIYKERVPQYVNELQSTLDKYKKYVTVNGKVDAEKIYDVFYDIIPDPASREGDLLFEIARYIEKDEWWQYTDPIEIDIPSKLGVHDKERTVKLKYDWFRNAYTVMKQFTEKGNIHGLNKNQTDLFHYYFVPGGYAIDDDMAEAFVEKSRRILRQMEDKYEDILF